MTAFERYGMKTSEKDNMHNVHWLTSTSRSAHRGRIKLLRGFVSKTSAALNPLTITQLACERHRGRSQTALHGPAHQLAVHMPIIISNNNNYGTRPRYTVRYAVLCH